MLFFITLKNRSKALALSGDNELFTLFFSRIDHIFSWSSIDEIDKIKRELNNYDETLVKKDKWIVMNKIDLLTSDEVISLKENFRKSGLDVYFISTIDKTGIKELTNRIEIEVN